MCLPGLERLLDLRVVEVVRRREVHDVDPLVREERVVLVVCGRDPLHLARVLRRADTPVSSTPRRRSASTCTTR
jgi:hypothetical protein